MVGVVVVVVVGDGWVVVVAQVMDSKSVKQ